MCLQIHKGGKTVHGVRNLGQSSQVYFISEKATAFLAYPIGEGGKGG